MWVFDSDSLAFLDVNKAAVAKYGYSRDEFLSMSIRDIYLEEDMDRLMDKLDGAKSNEIRSAECRHRLKSGDIIDVEVESQEIAFDGMRITISAIRDNTKHSKAEKDIRKEQQSLELSRMRLLGLINSAMDGIISLDENQNIILFNPASEQMFGVSAQEMMGKPIESLLPERYRAKHFSLVDGFGKSSEENASREMTGTKIVTGLRANGEEFPMEASISRIVVGGQKVYTVIHRDITSRIKARLEVQESEERFRKLYETAPVGISNLTPEGRFIRCNPALEKITGYSESELQSLSVYDITHPDDRESSEELLRMLTEGKVKTSSLEKRYVRKDGSTVWVQLVSTGVCDDKGNYLYTVSITQDITEQKNSQEKIKRLNRVYAVLSDINQTIVRVKDTHTLFEEACRIAIEVGKFKLAWVGVIDEKTGSIEPAAYSGDGDGLLELMKISASTEEPRGENSIGTALREKRPIVRNDVAQDRPPLPWYAEAAKREIRSFVVFPLTCADRIYGAICYYASEAGFFDEQEVALLEELSSDISFSITNIQRENEHRTLEKDRDRMFNYSLDMLSIVGFDMFLKQINPAWSRTLGWTGEELTAKSLMDFIHPDDREYSIKAMTALVDGRPGHGIENRWQCKDGSYKWLSWNCVPLVEEKMIFAVTRDVTEQKQNRDQLLMRNSAIQSSESAIGLADMQGKVFYVNSAFVKLWGYDDFNEVIGRDIFDFSIPTEKIQNAVSLMKSGKGFLGEGNARRKDGTPFVYQVTANIVMSENNEPICMMSSFMDITERKTAEKSLRNAYDELKQSEGKYRSLFEQTKEAILISNPDGSLVDVNPAAVELFAYDSKDDFLRNNIADLYIDSTDREMLFNILWRERYIKDKELVLRKKDGERIIVNLTAALMLDESKQNVSVLSVLRDVTKQKSLEAQLIQAQKLESLGTLAGGIAHDFNNILGIIMGYSAMIERRNLEPEKILKNAGAIQKATARGTALVKQLLTFARKGESAYQRVQLNDIVSEVEKLLGETLPKTIEIVKNAGAGLPYIYADPTQLHQVLLNLCVNARDAMPNGGTINIATEKVEGDVLASKFPAASEEKYVLLSVADTGTGMDEQTRKRIFDPFFTTKEVGKGTGLGLALVHSIVANHGGYIDLRTQPGKGTTFYIYIPVQERTTENVQSVELSLEDAPGGEETILFIEDEEMLRDLVRTVVEAKGYTVLTASDGEEGIELFKKRRDDIGLVISDLGLPKISGDEVLKSIRSIAPAARLVVASGFIEDDTRSNLSELGVTHFIEKPYRPAEVLRTIRESIDKK